MDPKKVSVVSEKKKSKKYISHFPPSLFPSSFSFPFLFSSIFSIFVPFFLASFFLISLQKFPGGKSRGTLQKSLFLIFVFFLFSYFIFLIFLFFIFLIFFLPFHISSFSSHFTFFILFSLPHFSLSVVKNFLLESLLGALCPSAPPHLLRH